MAPASAAPQYHGSDRSKVRTARPWHPLAYIIRRLPEALEGLAAGLDLPARPRVVDYGCADVPYRRFFPADTDYLAADLPGNPHANVVIDPDGRLEVEDESADVVMSTQVLEHVVDPAVYLAECQRVLRPGGQLLLSTHGFMVYHPDPDDYWRWTCAGLRKVVEDAGFEVERFHGVMGLAASGLQLLQNSLYWQLPLRPRQAVALVMQALIAVADRIEPDRIRDKNALVFALVARRR